MKLLGLQHMDSIIIVINHNDDALHVGELPGNTPCGLQLQCMYMYTKLMLSHSCHPYPIPQTALHLSSITHMA